MSYPSAARQAVILAKLEVTPGTFEPTASATDAVLIGNDLQIRPTVGKLDRGVLKSYFNGDESISGFGYVELSFSTEIAGSGTPGTAPAWGKLMRAAAFSEAITAGVKVDYTPVSDAFESLSMNIFYAGIRRSIRGARCVSATFDLMVNTVPKIRWSFVGLERAAPDDMSATAIVNPTLSMWQKPRAVSLDTGGRVFLGSTYTLSTGSISGGTAYDSKGMSVAVANEVSARPMLGWNGDNTPVTGRTVTANLSFDLLPADRVLFYADCKANTLKSMSLVLGGTTLPGGTVKFFMPKVEPMSPEDQDDGGLALDGWTMQVRPSVGNDEFRVVVM